MSIIIFTDTETTGLPERLGTDLVFQPYLTEIYALALEEDLETEVGEFSTLIRPPIPISQFITGKTGISDETVKDAPTFAEVFKGLKKFMKKGDILVAHNLPFDKTMFELEAQRLNKKMKFPKQLFCTVEQSLHLRGYRLRLAELYEMATGKTEYGAHRAKADVVAMIEGYRYIMEGNYELG